MGNADDRELVRALLGEPPESTLTVRAMVKTSERQFLQWSMEVIINLMAGVCEEMVVSKWESI